MCVCHCITLVDPTTSMAPNIIRLVIRLVIAEVHGQHLTLPQLRRRHRGTGHPPLVATEVLGGSARGAMRKTPQKLGIYMG